METRAPSTPGHVPATRTESDDASPSTLRAAVTPPAPAAVEPKSSTDVMLTTWIRTPSTACHEPATSTLTDKHCGRATISSLAPYELWVSSKRARGARSVVVALPAAGTKATSSVTADPLMLAKPNVPDN